MSRHFHADINGGGRWRVRHTVPNAWHSCSIEWHDTDSVHGTAAALNGMTLIVCMAEGEPACHHHTATNRLQHSLTHFPGVFEPIELASKASGEECPLKHVIARAAPHSTRDTSQRAQQHPVVVSLERVSPCTKWSLWGLAEASSCSTYGLPSNTMTLITSNFG